eukprot:TRINITY_DN2876_c0_g1_i2.p1 TRINITY_DN2876_c0_g1~~TRINITY_DN2876_c0_g1_i2.p1  ORF type:complete len:237 (-),score=103.77 TRINITY_DN2876_c0_g1_i2:2-712(-)
MHSLFVFVAVLLSVTVVSSASSSPSSSTLSSSESSSSSSPPSCVYDPLTYSVSLFDITLYKQTLNISTVLYADHPDGNTHDLCHVQVGVATFNNALVPSAPITVSFTDMPLASYDQLEQYLYKFHPDSNITLLAKFSYNMTQQYSFTFDYIQQSSSSSSSYSSSSSSSSSSSAPYFYDPSTIFAYDVAISQQTKVVKDLQAKVTHNDDPFVVSFLVQDSYATAGQVAIVSITPNNN